MNKKNKMKVMTVVGTRPEIIRLSRVICELEEQCNHILVHTGQNYDYELSQVFFDNLGIRKPDYFLNCTENSKSVSNTIGNIISSIDSVFSDNAPEALLVLGDTNSCLSVIPAKRRKIPIFHMEAGNRCYDYRVPEEINRKIIDHTSDINLPYSSIAREYLIKEGLPPDLIIKTGSPMYEVLTYYMPKIQKSSILDVLKLTPQSFFIVSVHREENIDSDKNFLKFLNLLNSIAEEHNLCVLVSTHPRTRQKIDHEDFVFHKHVKLLKPLGFFDYINLQMNSKAVLSDSGTINEEASILNVPAINLREAHERPEGMEEATVMMTGLEKRRVFQALAILENQKTISHKKICLVKDYSSPNVSTKVVRIILSYVDYVQRVIWKNY
jgi:UDP-N-acetyl-L-fucosamine synthase